MPDPKSFSASDTRPETEAERPAAQSFWQRLKERRPDRLAAALARFSERLLAALRIPEPEAPEWFQRVLLMERDVMLPVKVGGILIVSIVLYRQEWFADIANALDVEFGTSYFLWAYKALFWFYIAVNLIVAGWLLTPRRRSLSAVQAVPFAMSLLDGIMLSMLVLVTGGFNSILYWLYLGLIVRSAVSVPRGASQILLNLTLSGCFLFTGLADVALAWYLREEPNSRATLMLSEEYATEPVLLRLTLLLLMTIWCYAVPVLLERQRRIEEVAREVAAREGALRSAGRLAAEFAHQIKNPLAIINTAAFSLQRALKGTNTDAAEQIEMIQEEVERADRIITEVMGYAKLNEAHVEELNVVEELDQAIAQVFPPAARYPIQIHRKYSRPLPPLLMQRRHASEAFINLLQNAREALGAKGGNVFVTALCQSDSSIEVSIRDDGPGIAPDKLERIFQAYFTTKTKGSGLGLATAKQNVELYGGRVRVESVLGKGARFVLTFPAKTLTHLKLT